MRSKIFEIFGNRILMFGWLLVVLGPKAFETVFQDISSRLPKGERKKMR